MQCKIDHICYMSLPFGGLVVGFLGVISSVLLAIWKLKNGTLTELLYDDSQFRVLCLEAIISVLLIIGTKKKLELMLIPWLVIHSIALVMSIPTCLFFLVGNFFFYRGPDPYKTAALIICIASFGLYIWIGILALYCLVREERNCRPQWDAENQPQLYLNESHPELNVKIQPQFNAERTLV